MEYESVHRNWAAFLCLDFGIRCVIMCSTLCGFIVLLHVVRYGYNRHVYRYFGDLTPHRLGRIRKWLGLSFAVEIVNACIMEIFFWRRHYRLSVVLRLWNLMGNRYFKVFFTVIVGAIASDMFIAEVAVGRERKFDNDVISPWQCASGGM